MEADFKILSELVPNPGGGLYSTVGEALHGPTQILHVMQLKLCTVRLIINTKPCFGCKIYDFTTLPTSQ